MGITTLLSITVFLMLSKSIKILKNSQFLLKFKFYLVTENMPQTSEQLPLLGIYYAVTNVIVSLSTAMSVLTLHINHKGVRGQEVPKLVKTIFFRYIARIMRIKLESVTSRNLLNNRLLNESKNKRKSIFIHREDNMHQEENIALKLDKENNFKIVVNQKGIDAEESTSKG